MRCAAASWQAKIPRELGFKYLHVLRNLGGVVIKAEAAVKWSKKSSAFTFTSSLQEPGPFTCFLMDCLQFTIRCKDALLFNTNMWWIYLFKGKQRNKPQSVLKFRFPHVNKQALVLHHASWVVGKEFTHIQIFLQLSWIKLSFNLKSKAWNVYLSQTLQSSEIVD